MNDIPFTPPIPNDQSAAPEDQQHDGRVNIQIMTGAPSIKVGYIALVLHNVPIAPVQMPDGTELLVPCTQMTAREAMEMAMNLIHIAKIAENFAKEQL